MPGPCANTAPLPSATDKRGDDEGCEAVHSLRVSWHHFRLHFQKSDDGIVVVGQKDEEL